MDLARLAVYPLRAVLVATFGVLVMLQTLSFPGMFAHMAREEPDVAWLRWPLTTWAALEILCVQVVVVCTWELLTMVRDDRIFSDAALRWVDVMTGAVAAAWVLFAALFVAVGVSADDPGMPVVLFTILLVGGTLGLLLPVMRELLRRAAECAGAISPAGSRAARRSR